MECFRCEEPVQLKAGTKRNASYVCSFCPRAYHERCGRSRANEKGQIIGPCCDQRRPCEFCEHAVEPKGSQYRCTLCFRAAHAKCYQDVTDGPMQLSGADAEGVVFGEYAYVCRGCLMSFGVISVKKIEHLVTFINSGS
jgi:hypothetical protein